MLRLLFSMSRAVPLFSVKSTVLDRHPRLRDFDQRFAIEATLFLSPEIKSGCGLNSRRGRACVITADTSTKLQAPLSDLLTNEIVDFYLTHRQADEDSAKNKKR